MSSRALGACRTRHRSWADRLQQPICNQPTQRPNFWWWRCSECGRTARASLGKPARRRLSRHSARHNRQSFNSSIAMPTGRTRRLRRTSSRLHRSPSGPHDSRSSKPLPLHEPIPRLPEHESQTGGKCCPSRQTLLVVDGGLLLLANGLLGTGNTKGWRLGFM